MGFKNMKRDDHGHVIGNDETDGQKCQHQSGGNNKPENKPNENKASKLAKELGLSIKNEDDKKELALQLKSRGIAYDMSDAYNMIDEINSDAFDDDYNEEFDAWDREHMTTNKEPDARPNHTKLNDMNLSDSELWNMAYQYIGRDKLEKLAESLDLDSPQDLTTNDMLKAMPDDDIGDMMRINGLDDEFEDESQEEYEARIKPEAEKFKKQLDDAGYKLKDKEYGLEDAIKNADDDVLDNYFGKDTPERKLAGAMKGNDADKGIQNQINNAVNHFKQDYFLSNNSDEDVTRVAKKMGYNVKPIGERMANGAQKYQISKNDKAQPNRSDEDKAAYKKYWNAKGKNDADINLDRWNEIIEDSKPHYEDFDENEEVDYNGNKSKIIRRLSSDEKWDRSYANNPFAGDYYEVEYDLLGKPTRNIAWAGRLRRKGK